MALTTPTNDLTGNTIASTYDQLLFIDSAAFADSTLYTVSLQAGETALRVANDQVLIKDSSGTDIASCFEVQDKDGTVCLSVNGTNNRVGIGTTTPESSLDVNGSAVLSTTTGADRQIAFRDMNDAHGTSKIHFYDSAGGEGIDFYTGDGSAAYTTKMRIKMDGKVGIGTISPTAYLHVNNDTDLGHSVGDRQVFLTLSGDTDHGDGLETSLIRTSSASGLTDEWQTAQWRIGRKVDSTFMGWIGFGGEEGSGVANYGLSFGTGGAGDSNVLDADEAMRIEGSNGYVGIGTTAPEGLLHLSSTTNETPTLVIEKTGAANHDGGNIHFRIKEDSGFVDTGKEMGDIQWQSYDTTGGDTGYHTSAMIRAVTSGTHSNNVFGGEMQFWINSGEASTDQRMTIDKDGKVGIGATSPSELLHVENTVTTNYNTTDADTSAGLNTVAYFKNASTGALDNAMIEIVANSANSFIGTVYNSPNNGDLVFGTDGDSDGIERMRIMDNGYVGIGDTAPDAHLTVNQGSEDNMVMSFKSSDVAHGMTDLEETDTFGRFKKIGANQGGLFITGLAETGINSALRLSGYATDESNTRSASAIGAIHMVSALKSSATVGNMSADQNLMTIRNNNTTRYIFDSDGSAHADVEWIDFSDSRLKSSVEDIPYGLATVLQMQPKRYDKQSGDFDESGNVVLEDNKRKMIGFLAQDIKALMPELVKDVDTATSFYSLNYSHITAVLVKAIQELSAKVTALENA